VIYCA